MSKPQAWQNQQSSESANILPESANGRVAKISQCLSQQMYRPSQQMSGRQMENRRMSRHPNWQMYVAEIKINLYEVTGKKGKKGEKIENWKFVWKKGKFVKIVRTRLSDTPDRRSLGFMTVLTREMPPGGRRRWRQAIIGLWYWPQTLIRIFEHIQQPN